MILSNMEILAEIEAGRLEIRPSPQKSNFGPGSVDLTLDDKLHVWPDASETSGQPLDLSHPDFDVPTVIRRWCKEERITEDRPHVLKPNTLIIGYTHEVISLPKHLGARIEGRSRYARLGISIHATAPTVQPGYSGSLALEINNVGPFEIHLKPGLAIAQLIIERTGLPPTEGYAGQFQGQGTE